MDTVLCFCIFGGLYHYSVLLFYFRVEQQFAGGKFREITCAVEIYFTGGKFRAKSKFASIAKKILHAKNTCYTVRASSENNDWAAYFVT